MKKHIFTPLINWVLCFKKIDISADYFYPADVLSNFTERHFIFDGVEARSIEGVLQSFKFSDVSRQRATCMLVGVKAKRRGAKKNKVWKSKQCLWWNGCVYRRDSAEYQELVTRLYDAVFTQCEEFRNDLKATGKRRLSHSMGNPDIRQTVLTEDEFVGQLNRLRERL